MTDANFEENIQKKADPLLSVNYQVTLSDYATYNLFHNRVTISFISIFYAILFVGAALFAGAEADSLNILIPLGILLSLLFTALFVIYIKAKAKRVYNSNKLLRQETIIQFFEQGIHLETNASKGLIQWSDIYKVSESKKLFIIYIAQNQGMILPKTLINVQKLRWIIKIYFKKQ